MAYENVRQSGETNMFMLSVVIALASDFGADLDKKKVFEIMRTYNVLSDKYLHNT